MKCPRCHSDKLSVVDSRGDGDMIRRRRNCQECAAKFTTLEKVEFQFPMIIKKDGRREAFEAQKVLSGIRKACQKRPVSVESIDRMVENIELKVSEICEREIPSKKIGEFIMDQLREVDQIAYVRFASVYREFSDVSQFVETLNSLIEKKKDKLPARKRPEAGLAKAV